MILILLKKMMKIIKINKPKMLKIIQKKLYKKYLMNYQMISKKIFQNQNQKYH